MANEMTKKLLPVRHPNRDFFIADILDAVPKGDMGSMEHPLFSLSKKPDMTERHYEHNGNSLHVIPSGRGLATIWDKDILVYCVSQLVAGINLGREPSPTLHITAHDLLTATNRHTGGKNYAQLEEALNRLRGTTINTNLVTGGKADKRGFGMIDKWRIVERSATDDRMTAMEITLSDWLYRAALSREVLSLNPDYFRLASGIERRIYELARKHCGNQSQWRVGVELLYKKSGSRSPLKRFRHEIKRIAGSGIMPDYRIQFDASKDQVVFFNRKGAKAAKAEFDAAMKTIFQPEETKKRKRKHWPNSQIEIEL